MNFNSESCSYECNVVCKSLLIGIYIGLTKTKLHALVEHDQKMTSTRGVARHVLKLKYMPKACYVCRMQESGERTRGGLLSRWSGFGGPPLRKFGYLICVFVAFFVAFGDIKTRFS